MGRGMHDVSAFNIGEARTNSSARLDEARIAFARNIADHRTDVFTFTVAIGPDVEVLTPASLGFDVLGDALFAILDVRFDSGFEERRRVARVPLLVSLFEIVTDQMARYGGHDHIALAPGREVERELVVLVVCRVGDISL